MEGIEVVVLYGFVKRQFEEPESGICWVRVSGSCM